MNALFDALGSVDNKATSNSQSTANPIGSLYTPAALSGLMQPVADYSNIPTPQIYQPGQPVPTNLNPNLYSGGFPGQSSGYSVASPSNNQNVPFSIQSMNGQSGALPYNNPIIGATIPVSALSNLFGASSSPSIAGTVVGAGKMTDMMSSLAYKPPGVASPDLSGMIRISLLLF
jgi:hypothetical protein